MSTTFKVGENDEPSTTCWGCKRLIDEGSVVSFGDGIWHIDCFRCSKCENLIEGDANLLLLADGSPLCQNCSYTCAICSQPIYDEAIVTGDISYHTECFRCLICHNRIEGSCFAKTTQGIFCMACFKERKAKKRAARKKPKDHVEKSLPAIPIDPASVVPHPNSAIEEARQKLEANSLRPAALSSSSSSLATADRSEERPIPKMPSVEALAAAAAQLRTPDREDLPALPPDIANRPSLYALTPTLPLLPDSGTGEFETAAQAFTRASLRPLPRELGGRGGAHPAILPDPLPHSDRDGEDWLFRANPLELRYELVYTQQRLAAVETSYRTLRTEHDALTAQLTARRAEADRDQAARRAAEDQLSRLQTEYEQLRYRYLDATATRPQEAALATEVRTLRETVARLESDPPRPVSGLPDETEAPLSPRPPWPATPRTGPLQPGDPDIQKVVTKKFKWKGPAVFGKRRPDGDGEETHNPPDPSDPAYARHAAVAAAAAAAAAAGATNGSGQPGTYRPIAGPRPLPKFVTPEEAVMIDRSMPHGGSPHLTPASTGTVSQSGSVASSSTATLAPPNPAEPPTLRQHSFQPQAFLRPVKCDLCAEKIWNLSVKDLRCGCCNYNCHAKCLLQVPANCPGADYANHHVPLTGAHLAPSTTNEAGQDAMFGLSLLRELEREQRDVPWLVQACVAGVETAGLRMEGVYRRSGPASETRALHAQILAITAAGGHRAGHPRATPRLRCATEDDVTTLTGVLKQYLRDLAEPLLTFDAYPQFMAAIQLPDVESRCKAMQPIIHQLPHGHQSTIRFLMRHWLNVARHAPHNKMPSKNLAVVLGPNLLRTRDGDSGAEFLDMGAKNSVVELLIAQADRFWPADDVRRANPYVDPVPVSSDTAMPGASAGGKLSPGALLLRRASTDVVSMGLLAQPPQPPPPPAAGAGPGVRSSLDASTDRSPVYPGDPIFQSSSASSASPSPVLQPAQDPAYLAYTSAPRSPYLPAPRPALKTSHGHAVGLNQPTASVLSPTFGPARYHGRNRP
ncbi:Rho-type gtpase-activating protein [Tieghemiomyces parasiticus]|uniref:Rho-type gtpase-activating protein n=1 Tax=Tieghemiomyces parasiticus TaxID=78921 RepID=A0A9W8A0K3_9FUNG|nr:Rho-type gtpase-activating protein [Tieghemiomyces parasiticus]